MCAAGFILTAKNAKVKLKRGKIYAIIKQIKKYGEGYACG